MNGHAIGAPVLPARMPNPETVKVLEGLLAAARAGEVVSVACVYCGGPGKVQVTMNTDMPLELNLGVDMLKATLLRFMTTPPVSRILPARQMGG